MWEICLWINVVNVCEYQWWIWVLPFCTVCQSFLLNEWQFLLLYNIWIFMWITVQTFDRKMSFWFTSKCSLLILLFSLPFPCFFRPFQCEDSNKKSPKLCPVGKVLLGFVSVCSDIVLQWNISWVTTNVSYMWKYSNMLSVAQVPWCLFCCLSTHCFSSKSITSVSLQRGGTFLQTVTEVCQMPLKVSWPQI